MTRIGLFIHGWGAIWISQSCRLGMKPQSSFTCCSPTHRTGITLPLLRVIVFPNTLSHSNMPCAWWRSARCRKSAKNSLLASNQSWIGW